MPDWLMVEVAAVAHEKTAPPKRPLFAGFTPDVARNVMAAGKTARIVHRHPHDLRHRYASVKIAEGVPVTLVAAQLSYSRKSLTLDTYSHVGARLALPTTPVAASRTTPASSDALGHAAEGKEPCGLGSTMGLTPALWLAPHRPDTARPRD